MTNPRAKLNPIECRFVDEFLLDQDSRAAAMRAGFPKKTARREGRALLLNPLTRRAIQFAMDARSSRTMVSADSVLSDIQTVIARCMQATPVLDRRTGEPMMTRTADGLLAPAYKFDAANALKGLELIGKHLKLFGNDRLPLVASEVPNGGAAAANAVAMGLGEVLRLAGVEETPTPGGPVLEGELETPEGRSDTTTL